MKSGHKLALGALLAVLASSAGSAEPYRYGNCYSGCMITCRPGFVNTWQHADLACGPFELRNHCCEPMGFISQAQKSKPASPKVSTTGYGPVAHPKTRFPADRYGNSKVNKTGSGPVAYPKSKFPADRYVNSKVNKTGSYGTVSKSPGYTSQFQFPRKSSSPLR